MRKKKNLITIVWQNKESFFFLFLHWSFCSYKQFQVSLFLGAFVPLLMRGWYSHCECSASKEREMCPLEVPPQCIISLLERNVLLFFFFLMQIIIAHCEDKWSFSIVPSTVSENNSSLSSDLSNFFFGEKT